jgi:nucleoporin GLE1
MTSSSPLRRRSYQFTTPQRSSIALIDYLSESKNSEERHRKLLEAADKEHERVIADAERVFQQCQRLDHERRLKEEQRHIALQKQQEQDRLLLQAQVAREREELQRLREASASPAPSPAATLHHSPATPEPATASASGAKGLFGGKSVNALKAQQPPRSSPLAQPAEQAQPPALAPAIAQTIPRKPSQPFAEAQRASVSTFSSGVSTFSIPTATEQPKPQQQASSPALRSATGPDRYQTIHQNLKDLRKDLVQQAKVNPRLKARMGDMRREIRKSVGQLTGEKGANTSQVIRETFQVLKPS